MKKNWVMVLLITAAAVILCGAKMYMDAREQKEMERAAYREAYAALKLEVDPSMMIWEYGSDCDLNQMILNHTGEISYESDADPMKPGEYDVKFRLTDRDVFNQTVEREFIYRITVADTMAPEIGLSQQNCVIIEGDSFNPADNVISVRDPVDGELPYDAAADTGAWHLEGEYDPDTPGEYTLTVKAADINGNQAESEFTLNVLSKQDVNIPAEDGGGNPYYIRVNRAMNTVTVYALNDDGEYEPYTAFICSTGPATPLGTYATFGKSRWRLLYGPCYGQYATDIVGDILFHSVPYFTQDEGDLEYEEYNQLGTSASMGCVRLCVRDAKWIYDNCPETTVVEFYDDYDSYGPLGRPESIWIDPESEYRGWDPTDPSPSNPWKQ